MTKVAIFEKVSYEQFLRDVLAVPCPFGNSPERIRSVYDSIRLPERSTSGSAGYDFFIPDRYILLNWDSVSIPTGIRCKMETGWVLMLMPKSGIGSAYGFRLMNTTGVIDSDYYHSDNEGHIHASVRMEINANEPARMHLAAGQKFMQGIFLPFGITHDDDVTGVRNGGFGSTGV